MSRPTLGRRGRVLVLVAGLIVVGGCTGGSVQGQSDDTVQASGTPEINDHTTYYPGNDTVRFPAALGQGNVVEWNSVSFEEYARLHCGDVAHAKISNLVAQRFDPSTIGTVGDGNESIRVTYDQSADPERIDANLPNQVETTVHLFNRTHTCLVPVTLAEAPEGGLA